VKKGGGGSQREEIFQGEKGGSGEREGLSDLPSRSLRALK